MKATVNSSCPGCGRLIAQSSWGRYMRSSGMGMLEFASYEEEDYTNAQQAKQVSHAFSQSAPVKKEQTSPSVDLTSNLFDD